jgi:hypothetical protein
MIALLASAVACGTGRQSVRFVSSTRDVSVAIKSPGSSARPYDRLPTRRELEYRERTGSTVGMVVGAIIALAGIATAVAFVQGDDGSGMWAGTGDDFALAFGVPAAVGGGVLFLGSAIASTHQAQRSRYELRVRHGDHPSWGTRLRLPLRRERTYGPDPAGLIHQRRDGETWVLEIEPSTPDEDDIE